MKITKIIPRGAWVLVKPEGKPSQESEFGIISPDSVEKEQRAIGIVLEMGPDVEGLKIKDRVLFGKFAGEQIKMFDTGKKDDVDYILLPAEEILATLI